MTGLRIDTAVAKIQKRLAKLKQDSRAEMFRPELERFAQRVLTNCVVDTPVRDEALIASNQAIQYRHRVNYIPSVHELSDPSLIVNEQGQFWIFYGGKWYNGDHRLPIEVWGAFEELNQERNRRLETTQGDFINERKQARFLYQKSWNQVAQSLGLSIGVSTEVINSHSRANPPREPLRGYGQWRGGQQILSVVIFNPFLDEDGQYWKGNGRQILAQSIAKERVRFYKDVNDKISRLISAARQSA